jgi:hypothetical protein
LVLDRVCDTECGIIDPIRDLSRQERRQTVTAIKDHFRGYLAHSSSKTLLAHRREGHGGIFTDDL